MRKVVASLGISIDGYIARPDGSVDFLFMPKDFSMAPFLSTIDTAIMGRKSWEAAMQMGGLFGTSEMTNYVLSRTEPPGDRQGVTFTNQSPDALVRVLRERSGKNIWLMGGGEVVRDFLKADLIDELYLGVVPVLLGKGIPLFPADFPQRDFKLVESKTYSKGLVTLIYQRSRLKRASKS